jgi:hypothetical protein
MQIFFIATHLIGYYCWLGNIHFLWGPLELFLKNFLKVVFPFKRTFSQLVFAPFKFMTSSNPDHKPHEDVVGGYPKICNPITMSL